MVFSSGLFVPVDKQSLFIVAFEDILISSHNVVPLFVPPINQNSCEINLKYIGSNKQGSPSMSYYKAKEFLKENLHILENKTSKKKRKLSKKSVTAPQVIDLEDENFGRTVDLTDSTSEIIVIDDNTSRISEPIDLIELDDSVSFSRSTVQDDSEIQVLNVKSKQILPSTSTSSTTAKLSDGEVLVIRSVCKPGKKKSKFNQSSFRNFSGAVNHNNLRPIKKVGSVSSLQSDNSTVSITKMPSRKKKKLQDIGNIPLMTSSPRPLSDGTLKYYENIDKAIRKIKNRDKKSPKRKHTPDKHNHLVQQTSKKRKTNQIKRSKHKERKHLKSSQGVLRYSQRNVRPSRKSQNLSITERIKLEETTNAYNPNPLVVDVEGLRPIAIDGSNVAIGHGRGTFSARGLKICIDYFVSKGHRAIKVFLPLYREKEIPKELLNELKLKCDLVFTPSQCINGSMKVPYDDRFIIQYAAEFGGVVVSTDNFRDLFRENRKWRGTIEKRILMFTWVDDFLMFPLDPLGRSGPTLEEFLRF